MATTYDIGDRPTITGTFRNLTDTLENPSTVTATCRRPDGTLTSLTPATASTGIWTALLPTLDQAGVWGVRMAGTAGLVAAGELSFRVRPQTVL